MNNSVACGGRDASLHVTPCELREEKKQQLSMTMRQQATSDDVLPLCWLHMHTLPKQS
jgi:hypothetical protein